ncbi:putative membrane protein [Jezberella montanilacus]|jgi:uncharacterized membrane protein|uniref:Putative membrane protein n=2 Tax=Jezberella montanilacus TaxID=323426 RepID=A0A2T0XCG2_9BURK|nr:DUF2069 domain-containing protein [Jezberella montanilacus]PRY96602.1 putative membrane protein [Jezberella montanilacus]
MMMAAGDTVDKSKTLFLSNQLRRVCWVCLLALILLSVLWETWLAPIKPGGSLLFLKALPLAFAVRGVIAGRLYTVQWASMLILLYLMEGVVRLMSDPPGPSVLLAGIEIFLSTVFFFCAIFYVYPAKKLAKSESKLAKQANPRP